MTRSRSALVVEPRANAPTLVLLKLCIAVGTKLQVVANPVFAHVYMVRCSIKSGVALNRFPSRSTCATAPFSTMGPSGESENKLVAEVVQVPMCVPEGSVKFQ